MPISLPIRQDATSEATDSKLTNVDPWKVKAVIGFLPHLIDEAAIIKALGYNGGDINNAVSMLLDAEYISSQSSTPASLSTAGSSSIERDSDTDDEEIYRPSKRQNCTTKTERSLIEENDVPHQIKEARSPKTLVVELGVDSDEEVIQGSHNRKNRTMKTGETLWKHDRKNRIAQVKATSASDVISSESELESELESGRLHSSNRTIKQTTIDASREKDDENEFYLSAHVTKAKVKLTDGKTKEDDSGDLDPPSDSEADDEYQPDGDDEADSDFMPNTGVSTFHGSSLYDQRKNLHSKKVQKHARKDGKRTKPSDKLLGRTIKNFDHTRIPSSIEKVVGMKVLFI